VSEEQREDLTSTSLGFFVADTDANNNNTAAHTNFFISIARLHLTVTIRHLNNPVPTQTPHVINRNIFSSPPTRRNA
jgi:hypothetical protein